MKRPFKDFRQSSTARPLSNVRPIGPFIGDTEDSKELITPKPSKENKKNSFTTQ